jgi:hypothetical protein
VQFGGQLITGRQAHRLHRPEKPGLCQSAELHKIGDEFCQRFEGVDLSGISGAFPYEIDVAAAQKMYTFRNPAICDRKAYRRQLT